MSGIVDRFRETAARLLNAFDAPSVTITRKVAGTRSNADRAAGTVAPTTTSFTGRGILGSRKVRSDDGTIRQEAMMRLNVAVQDGDRITVGARIFTVTSVTEINPDGTTPIIWVASVK